MQEDRRMPEAEEQSKRRLGYGNGQRIVTAYEWASEAHARALAQ